MKLIWHFSSVCRWGPKLTPMKNTLPMLAACRDVTTPTVIASRQRASCLQYHTKPVPLMNCHASNAFERTPAGRSKSIPSAQLLNSNVSVTNNIFHQIQSPSLQKSFFQYYHTTSNILSHDKQTASSTSGNQRGNKEQNERNIESLIETWFYEVCPHGSLEASLPFKTVIKSLNPQDHPDMNKVIVQVHFDTDDDMDVPDGNQLSQISDLYDLRVDFDADKANMKVTCDVTKGVTVPVVCTLQVPLKYDLSVKMTEARDLSIQGMESDTISVESEKGNCYLTGVKCGSISAVCRSGNIISHSTLLGNTYFHTGKSGSITTGKLQGSNITCETEMGSVVVKSLYADNAIFRSHAGSIHLGHCHGQLYLQAENSQLKLESLDGDLDISLQSGSVDAHLSRHSKADIEVKTGDISLSFPEGVCTDLNLDCRGIVVDKNMDVQFIETGLPHHKEGHIGEKGKALVNARTLSGTIHLKLLDWIQTTKLAFQTDEEV